MVALLASRRAQLRRLSSEERAARLAKADIGQLTAVVIAVVLQRHRLLLYALSNMARGRQPEQL